jgi:hypothetical protein
MTLRDHLRAWACHAALNAGEAVFRARHRQVRRLAAAVIHVAVPPQLTHRRATAEYFATQSPLRCFMDGVK